MPWLVPTLERDARSFRRDALRLLAVVFILPNLAFGIASVVWGLRRPPVNLDYAVLALVAPWLGAVGMGVAVGIFALLELLVALSYRFHGNPAALLDATAYVTELRLGPVLGIGLVLVALTVATCLLVRRGLRHTPRRLGPNLAALIGAVAIWLCTDRLEAAHSNAVVLGDLLDAVVPRITLATERRGVSDLDVPSATAPLFAAVKEGGRLPPRIGLVIVESMGLIHDRRLENAMLAPLHDPALQSAYRVMEGTLHTHGPTVMGEVRELCHAQAESVMLDPAQLPRARCLPALLAGRGYRTIAMHGFKESFFNRGQWWPAVGFDSMAFEPDIARSLPGIGRCGKMLHGICDSDALRAFETELAHARRPTFAYWMTLSAHWPFVLPDTIAKPATCGSPATGEVPAEVCALLYFHGVVLDGIRRTALRLSKDTVAFVVVGDHGALGGSDEHQAAVAADSVPYVILWPRALPLPSR